MWQTMQLTGRNGMRETGFQRCRLVLGMTVHGSALPGVAELPIGTGMLLVAVVGVHDMAARATGAAVVTGLVVRTLNHMYGR